MVQYAVRAQHRRPGADGGAIVAAAEQMGEIPDMAWRVLPLALRALDRSSGEGRAADAHG
jgi:hypothetical protein